MDKISLPISDDLYELIPVVYRQRDAAEGYPLKALLQVINEQVTLVEEDIEQLYENWFVETAVNWAIPYIGELIGYEPVREAGRLGESNSQEDQKRNQILVPRREVTNTIRYRRRKGTLALLEMLAQDVAGWPARAVEFFRQITTFQSVNHIRPDAYKTIDVRQHNKMVDIGTPFDKSSHTIDVRRINSTNLPGKFNLKNVGVFVWRLRAYPVTMMSPYLLEDVGTHSFNFSILGNDSQLFTKPEKELSTMTIANELNVPSSISRRAFYENMAAYYGDGKSIGIYRENPDTKIWEIIPVSQIIPADLSGWQYEPPSGFVALDPELGRFALSPLDRFDNELRVIYHYGFSGDVGGGEYGRILTNPIGATMYYIVPGIEDDKPNRRFARISDALKQWQEDQPSNAIIELTENEVYADQLHIKLAENQSLQIRAANHIRPAIRLLDFRASRSDALRVDGAPGSRFAVDGLLISGRGIMVTGEVSDVTIRHSTLVPGWTLTTNCEPNRPAESSLILHNTNACVTVQRSILGSIQVKQDEVATDPILITLEDSILDATDEEFSALDAAGWPLAHAILTIKNSTIIGQVLTHAIELGENSIFLGNIEVGRSQIGCLRFCYVPPGSRTPRQYNCQPNFKLIKANINREFNNAQLELTNAFNADLKKINANEDLSETDKTAAIADKESQFELDLNQLKAQFKLKEILEPLRIKPRLNSLRYGTATYCQLSDDCAPEIKRGAEDESEMGVFYHLYQPQREANLTVRLKEYTPAGMDVGIIYAS